MLTKNDAKAQVQANLPMLLAYVHSLHAETTEVNGSCNFVVYWVLIVWAHTDHTCGITELHPIVQEYG